MTFPWRKRARAAEAAALAAQDGFTEAQQQRREVERIVGVSRLFRERNHFAEAIETLLRPPRPRP